MKINKYSLVINKNKGTSLHNMQKKAGKIVLQIGFTEDKQTNDHVPFLKTPLSH